MASARPSLKDAAVDIAGIQAYNRTSLLDLLHSCPGRKVLLLDGSLSGPLSLICDPSDLKDHGAQWSKLGEPIKTDCNQIIFLVRSIHAELMSLIAAQIHADESQGLASRRKYVVIFMPRKSEQCLQRLEQENVLANVDILEHDLHFFPVDDDVLSMEMSGVYRDFHLHGDPTTLFYAAHALMSMQNRFGIIPSVHAIGSSAKYVAEVIIGLRKEKALDATLKDPTSAKTVSQVGVPPVAPKKEKSRKSQQPKIQGVVLVDRGVDLFSVLCSQFTYQALIDDIVGIKDTVAELGSQITGGDAKKVRLSSDDPLFKEVRDLHIGVLGPLLHRKASEIQTTYAQKDNLKNIEEMHQYMKKFKEVQGEHTALQTHVNLAAYISTVTKEDDYMQQLKAEDEITAGSSGNTMDYIEELIDDKKPLELVFRLLCLYSLVNNGIRAKQLDHLKKAVLQMYGYEQLLTLCALEQVGLLRYQGGKSLWPQVKKNFNLFVDESEVENDISYAYSGYAPLSVRLVQVIKSLQHGWRSCTDALNLLNGPALIFEQPPDRGTVREPSDPSAPQVVLVFFLGGVTYAEIAALRKLSEMEGSRRKFIIATTEFLGPKKLFDSLKNPEVFDKPPRETAAPKQETRSRFGLPSSLNPFGRS